MFHKSKLYQSHARHYSGQRVIADQIDAKVLNTGVLTFTTNNSASVVGPKLYVSELGSDSNQGSQDSPFASLQQAFVNLSQTTWDGEAEVYIDGSVEVEAGSSHTLAPAPGVSGSPYKIVVKGLNVSSEGPFTVQSAGTWSPGSLAIPEFQSVVLNTAPTTASKGKMIHFESGLLSGQRIPLHSQSGTTLNLIVATGAISPGDQLSIETHADSLALTGGVVDISSLSRIPVCLRSLDISTDGSFFNSEDQAGELILEGVKVQGVTTGLFHHNVSGQGIWLTGSGAIQDRFSPRSFLTNVLLSDSSTLRAPGNGVYSDSYYDIVSESDATIFFETGVLSLNNIGLTDGRLSFILGCTGKVNCLGLDGVELALSQSSLVINRLEATGNVNGVDLDLGSELLLGDTTNLHDNGAYGLSVGRGSRVYSGAPITGSGNGTAGIHVETGSKVVLPGSSTISGPVGPATDSYELNSLGVNGAGTDTDPSDLTQIAFY